MAKTTTDKKDTSNDVDDQFDKMEGFNTEVCKLKHVAIDKEFGNIKTDADRRHEEIKELIKSVKICN